jgi:hypothetical protein
LLAFCKDNLPELLIDVGDLNFVWVPQSRPTYLIVNIVNGVGEDKILHILEGFDSEPSFAPSNERNTFWLDRLYRTRACSPHQSGPFEVFHECSSRRGSPLVNAIDPSDNGLYRMPCRKVTPDRSREISQTKINAGSNVQNDNFAPEIVGDTIRLRHF